MSQCEKQITPESPDDAWVGHYVLCFIDILGQQAGLARWAELPDDLKPSPDFIEAMKKTVGSVLVFRDIFQSLFDTFSKSTIPQALIDALPAEKQALYTRYRHCILTTQQFGDTFVFYAPIPNASGDVSMVAPFRMLVACCGAMIASLAGQVPIRGAVSVGVGTEIATQTLYGPVLAAAHHVESRVADYPRIVISQSAISFFKGNAGFSDDSQIDVLMKSLAAVCRSLLCRDQDGQVIVDYLGQGMRDLQGGVTPETLDAIEKAYRFVRSEATRFQDEGCEKLEVRYTKVLNYFHARLPIWGLGRLREAWK